VQAVDAAERPEIKQHYFAAQLSDAQRLGGVYPTTRAGQLRRVHPPAATTALLCHAVRSRFIRLKTLFSV